MCGIVGAAGLVTGKEETIVKQLLIVDSLRGVDSTGVAVIPRHNVEPKISKQVGNPFELSEHKSFDKAFAGINRVMIGHNRWGTLGGATRANAHPFDFDTVVGVHNGTITSKWKMENGNDFAVDSAAIYNNIDKHGIKDTVDKMHGAYALVWWDKFTEEINFIRNKERPLYVAYNLLENVLFWASESWMLDGILHRNEVVRQKIELLPVDTHVRISVDKDGKLGKPQAQVMQQPFFQQPAGKTTQTIFVGTGANAPAPAPSVPPIIAQPKLTIVPKAISPKGEAKNDRVAPETAEKSVNVVQNRTSGTGLTGLKQVSLEVLSHCENDGWGGAYLSLYDENNKYATIRWYYPRRTDYDAYIGEFITADIGPRIDRGNHPSFYKVVSNSVKLVEQDQEGFTVADANEELEQERAANQDELFADSRGRLISEVQWLAKHGTCDWCSDNIFPTEPHAFSSAGQCFCKSCMKSDDVQQYAHFTSLVN